LFGGTAEDSDNEFPPIELTNLRICTIAAPHYVPAMSSCLAVSDFNELGDAMLSAFDRRVERLPSGLCAPFYEEARNLETELLSIYRMVALLARREEDLSQIADLWAGMTEICRQATARLHDLSQSYPNCGTQIYYDRILDLTNKCQRLNQIHR